MPPKRKKDDRYRSNNFLGTLWLDIPPEDFCTWKIPSGTSRYYVCYQYQHEVAPNPETGHHGHHIQFFCTTKARWTYEQLTRCLGLEPREVHFENAYDAAAAWTYCGPEKQEAVQTRCGLCQHRTFGEKPKERPRGGGARQRQQFEQRYRELVTAIDAGQSITELLRGPLGGFVFQRISNVKTAKGYLTAPKNTPDEWSHRTVTVFFGAAGTGKSRAAREECARFGHRLWVAPIGFTGVW